ncbi:hypothetical protein PR048_013015 [Dryococelus australis]|uniref:Uncharacterized protein n=1 Tax=Dryococelus australis TaxID=614101 RepID=A0ABQ9HQZ7_9NEOP|nr:hypothetical protein PR048_013015 [Dryococelus australis]
MVEARKDDEKVGITEEWFNNRENIRRLIGNASFQRTNLNQYPREQTVSEATYEQDACLISLIDRHLTTRR